MWTPQLWVRGGGVRGNCVMQVWLLSCHSVSPPWVWALFVRAPSGLHVLCVFLVLPCLHVCVLFYICVGACICFEHDAQSDDDVCVYGTTSRPQYHRGTTHGTTQWTTTGQSAGQPPGQPWDDPRHSHGTSPIATTRKGFGARRRQAQVTSAADAGLYRRVLRLDVTPRSLLSHP